jgi:Protein of unknown function (DUF3631)
VFAEKNSDRLTSEALVSALVAMTDRPWGECNHGKALTPNQLARRLRPFGVRPKDVGPEHKRVKGYAVESFADAFARYLPPDSTAQPSSGNGINDLDEKQTAQPFYGCADANDPNHMNSNDLRGCADESPPGMHKWRREA